MLISNNFLTHSLRQRPDVALEHCLAAVIAASDPASAVTSALKDHDLDAERVFLLAIGKAAAPMASAAADVLGEKLTTGLVLSKDGHLRSVRHDKLHYREASHPWPDQRGLLATQEIIELLTTTSENDLVLVLLSGGASALAVAPAPGLSLADKQQVTKRLMQAGADIIALNTVRKHLSSIKGGQLARLAAPARLLTLAISDVIMPDPAHSALPIIGSGPTVPDPSSFRQAWGIIKRFGLQFDLPPAVREHFWRGLWLGLAENPMPNDPILKNNPSQIILSLQDALEAAEGWGRGRGLTIERWPRPMLGEAREAIQPLLKAAKPQTLLVAGGETTVTVRGNGLGGRNQELALAAVRPLAGRSAVLAAFATDGGDGPTKAAGAVVTGDTLARAEALGLDVEQHLGDNNAYAFFAALDDLILCGPTQTNVNDVCLLWLD
jgi:glycerate 2-kinase